MQVKQRNKQYIEIINGLYALNINKNNNIKNYSKD